MSAGDNLPRIILSGTDLDLPPDFTNSFAKYTRFEPLTKTGKTTLESCWDSATGRTVALKRLQPTFCRDRDERRRFLREARVTAQLAHPNTVPVYEIGLDDQSNLYFTMKKIAGEDLFRILQRQSWSDPVTLRDYPLERLLEIIIQASLALAYAHAHGVIHRDVKPENIWVGNFGEVILLDWGVAKVWGRTDPKEQDGGTDPASAESGSDERIDDERIQTLTLTGQRPGTPLYMSPEQVQGSRSIDERTDIFSMGVLLYEMLAFKEPFRGPTIHDTFDNILHTTPVPPSRVEQSRNAPPRDIPSALEDIVMKAIAKQPDQRFQSMLDMIEALRSCLRGVVRGSGPR